MVTWGHDSSQVSREQQIRDSYLRARNANGATPSTMLDMLDVMTEVEIWKPFGFATFTKFALTPTDANGLGFETTQEVRAQLEMHHKDERGTYRKQATIERMEAMRSRVTRLLGDDIPEAREHRRPRPDDKDGATIFMPNQVDSIVARLKRDDPVLAEQVIGGEITANAAAIKKRWRHPRIVVSSPEAVAKALRKHLSDEDRHQLVELLQGDWSN